MKIVTVIGARPQFIKAAAVSRELANHADIREIIVHTGQHFDKNMSGIFFEEMQIPKPDYFLDINSMSHGAMTGRMLEKIEEVLIKERPDYVMVYGDTNTTIAGALAAKKLHIKVVHVEAGLRSFNMRMPEEINRILTDRISDVLCCPTDKAVANLDDEGFGKMPCAIRKTGDVMLDAAMFYSRTSEKKSAILKRLDLGTKDFILCTIHRAENTDNEERLLSIVSAMNALAESKSVVLPLHPRTAKILRATNGKLNFSPIDPVGYFDMLELLKHTKLVMTDSGGLQKEAYFFSRPCVTLRDESEWTELIDGGFNVLAGAEKRKILECCSMMLSRKLVFDPKLYGNSAASANIIKAVSEHRSA